MPDKPRGHPDDCLCGGTGHIFSGGVKLDCRFPVARRGEADSAITWPTGAENICAICYHRIDAENPPPDTDLRKVAAVHGEMALKLKDWGERLESIAIRVEKLEAENERLRLVAAPGRRTESEYQRMGRPDGWTWNEQVQMWCRYDQDHWDAINRVDGLVAELDATKQALQWERRDYGKLAAASHEWRNKAEKFKAERDKAITLVNEWSRAALRHWPPAWAMDLGNPGHMIDGIVRWVEQRKQ